MIKCIITNIEGTTTSKDFIHHVLFKYAHDHIAEFVEHQAGDDIVESCIAEAIQTIIEEDKQGNDDNEKDQLEPTRENAVDKLLFWIETDRNHPALKKLQEYIRERGFHEGKFKGHIYEDVPLVLEKWQKEGIKLGLFSSGSVKTQKLIFGFSESGDLTKYFDFYFDTETGPKKEVDSYRNIQQQVGAETQEILFISDLEVELDAAKNAGLQSIQIVRGETKPSQKHPKANDFPEVDEKMKYFA
jgi:enolase-phosphatase E1